MPDLSVPRSPLERAALEAAAGPARRVRLLAEAPSTNAVAAEAAAVGLVVVADHQTAGRGRLDRGWQTPPGAALTLSAVVDPGVPDELWPLLPLAAGLAVTGAVRRTAGVPAVLKWPNDVLVEQGPRPGKLAGILLERVVGPDGPVAVLGIGLNVHQTAEELPVPTATSLALCGVEVDRTALFGAVLAGLDQRVGQLRVDHRGLLADYRGECTTLGAVVDVHLPGGTLLSGTAEDVDAHGRIVVAGRAVGAGDVVHLRPRSAADPGACDMA